MREFHRFEMYSNETGPKFVDCIIRGRMAKIGSQREREVPTGMTIITVAKEEIRLQHVTLYQLLEIMLNLSLDKLYKAISKWTVSERSVATKSLTVNGRYCHSGDDVERRDG